MRHGLRKYLFGSPSAVVSIADSRGFDPRSFSPVSYAQSCAPIGNPNVRFPVSGLLFDSSPFTVMRAVAVRVITTLYREEGIGSLTHVVDKVKEAFGALPAFCYRDALGSVAFVCRVFWIGAPLEHVMINHVFRVSAAPVFSTTAGMKFCLFKFTSGEDTVPPTFTETQPVQFTLDPDVFKGEQSSEGLPGKVKGLSHGWTRCLGIGLAIIAHSKASMVRLKSPFTVSGTYMQDRRARDV